MENNIRTLLKYLDFRALNLNFIFSTIIQGGQPTHAILTAIIGLKKQFYKDDFNFIKNTFTVAIPFVCSKSRKENPQKLTRLSPRSHPGHLVGKRTPQKDAIKDITSDSQMNSYFPYRRSPACLTIIISNRF